MIVYALKRFIFLTGLIILMQNEVDKPTRHGSILRSVILCGTFRRISQRQRAQLKLEELSSLFIVYNITIF